MGLIMGNIKRIEKVLDIPTWNNERNCYVLHVPVSVSSISTDISITNPTNNYPHLCVLRRVQMVDTYPDAEYSQYYELEYQL